MNETRTQRVHYALINQEGTFWQGLTLPTAHALYKRYGTRAASIRDGWNVVKVTLYFNRPSITTLPVSAATGTTKPF